MLKTTDDIFINLVSLVYQVEFFSPVFVLKELLISIFIFIVPGTSILNLEVTNTRNLSDIMMIKSNS